MFRSILAVLCLTLAAMPATASADAKRSTRLVIPAHTAVKWTTPQAFGSRDTVTISVYVNGHKPRRRTYSANGLFYSGHGIIVEVTSSRRERAPLRFRVANFRERDQHVRLGYDRA